MLILAAIYSVLYWPNMEWAPTMFRLCLMLAITWLLWISAKNTEVEIRNYDFWSGSTVNYLCCLRQAVKYLLCLIYLYMTMYGTPLQYSRLENPMDGGAWWAAVHGVTKSRTRLSYFTFTFHFHALEKEMATHSSVLAWRVPGTAEPGGLLSMGSHRVGHDWSDLAACTSQIGNCLCKDSGNTHIWEDMRFDKEKRGPQTYRVKQTGMGWQMN